MPEPTQSYRSDSTLNWMDQNPPLSPRDYNQRRIPIRSLVDRSFRLQDQTREALGYRNLFCTERQSQNPPPIQVTLVKVKDLLEDTLLKIKQIQCLFRVIQSQTNNAYTGQSSRDRDSNASH